MKILNNNVHDNLKILADICNENLHSDKEISEYINLRQLSPTTVEKFKIGAFPKDVRNVLKYVHPTVLKDAGIIYNASSSTFKSYYRFVIPVQDASGNFIGIAGRALMPDDERKFLRIPKYKNSIYNKSKVLFGLNYAKTTIRNKNSVIVVEGNLDVISCHQAGIYNVVATCGTLLTERHIIMLSRYTDNINILFDNDPAGNMAAERFIKKRAKNGINLKKLTIPTHKDADEFIKNNSIEQVNLFFQNH